MSGCGCIDPVVFGHRLCLVKTWPSGRIELLCSRGGCCLACDCSCHARAAAAWLVWDGAARCLVAVPPGRASQSGGLPGYARPGGNDAGPPAVHHPLPHRMTTSTPGPGAVPAAGTPIAGV